LLALLAAGCAAVAGDDAVSQSRQALGTNDPVRGSGPPNPVVDGGVLNGDGGTAPVVSGQWTFDDCAADSLFLADATGNGANAERATTTSCAAGIHGQGLQFQSAADVVEIPDQPQFTVTDRIAVAAWVNPSDVSGTRPIVAKHAGGQSAFALSVHDGEAEFAVRLTSGKTVRSRAPITANAWAHIAGTYDGNQLSLFVNGKLAGLVSEPGQPLNVAGPMKVGALSKTQFFSGLIDEVWISTKAVVQDDLTALSCFKGPRAVSVTGSTEGAVTPNSPAHYAVTVQNQDIGFCAPSSFFFSTFTPVPPTPVPDPAPPLPGSPGNGGGPGTNGGSGSSGGAIATGTGSTSPGIPRTGGPIGPPTPTGGATGDGGNPVDLEDLQIVADPSTSPNIGPGESFTFNVTITATDDAPVGAMDVPISVFSNDNFQAVSSSLHFELKADTGCHVTTGRELMVRDVSVVEDPVRTTFASPPDTPHRGVWTFARLMRDMAPTPAAAPAFAERLFKTWLTDQVVNGFTTPARPAIKDIVLDKWPRSTDGSLDLEKAPLRLLAIVNRIDQRNVEQGHAGEGRFVFGVLQDDFTLSFTVILEFEQPAKTAEEIQGWADQWHALASLPFPSEQYNAALEAVTLRFSGRGAAPERPNGSALDQLRTNEIALAGRWEFRQFGIAGGGFFEPRPVALTPDLSFNGSDRLARYINDNEAALLLDQQVLPLQVEGQSFATGSVFNDLIAWTAPGVKNNEARFHLSVNTCNGCHGSAETNTGFLQVSPRALGQRASLSPFLMGTTVNDTVTQAPRTLNDLQRRRVDLASLVCPSTPPPPNPAGRMHNALMDGPRPTLTKGIQRVH
jgi:hypothetical protein